MTLKQLKKANYIFGKDLEIIKDYCVQNRFSVNKMIDSPDMMIRFYSIE